MTENPHATTTTEKPPTAVPAEQPVEPDQAAAQPQPSQAHADQQPQQVSTPNTSPPRDAGGQSNAAAGAALGASGLSGALPYIAHFGGIPGVVATGAVVATGTAAAYGLHRHATHGRSRGGRGSAGRRGIAGAGRTLSSPSRRRAAAMRSLGAGNRHPAAKSSPRLARSAWSGSPRPGAGTAAPKNRKKPKTFTGTPIHQPKGGFARGMSAFGRGAGKAATVTGRSLKRVAGWRTSDGRAGWSRTSLAALGRGITKIAGIRKGGYMRRLTRSFGRITKAGAGRTTRKIAGWVHKRRRMNNGTRSFAWTLLLALLDLLGHNQPDPDQTDDHTADKDGDQQQPDSTNATSKPQRAPVDIDDAPRKPDHITGGTSVMNDKLTVAAEAITTAFDQINPESDQPWEQTKVDMQALGELVTHLGVQVNRVATRYAETPGMTSAFAEPVLELGRHLITCADKVHDAIGGERAHNHTLVSYAEESGPGVFDKSRQQQ